MSDDGHYGITIIALIGSVFSSHYHWSGRGNPLNHCAMNVALYRPRGSRWAMTERDSAAVDVTPTELTIGPSQMRWDGDALVISIDETTCPLPTRLRGTIKLVPQALNRRAFALDAAGRHQWWPIAPKARIEVDMINPSLRWSGAGYFDCNRGTEPLEAGFKSWNWCYARLKEGPAIFYDVTRRDGSKYAVAACCDASGTLVDLEPPPIGELARTLWRMPRATHADRGSQPRVLRTLEDAPFYSRSVVQSRIFGEETVGMHESLCLERLSSKLVRLMIPFRNPRMRSPRPK